MDAVSGYGDLFTVLWLDSLGLKWNFTDDCSCPRKTLYYYVKKVQLSGTGGTEKMISGLDNLITTKHYSCTTNLAESQTKTVLRKTEG